MLRLAIVGDIHGHWSDADARSFEELAYDQVLVVGDLAGLRWSGCLAVAKAIGAMRAPAIVFPGNHDASHPLQLLAEIAGHPTQGDRYAELQGTRVEALRAAVSPHELAGYSLHRLSSDVTIVAGRPHSMGGPTLSFPGHLRRVWGIGDLETSAARLCALVDEVETEQIVFLSHNGPTGLGSSRTRPWGCDFKRTEGDWGDPDLGVAVAHAVSSGKRVRAVFAGHMHRLLKGGGRRVWHEEVEGVAYVNAAEVPRVTARGRHHVAVEIEADALRIEDRWLAR